MSYNSSNALKLCDYVSLCLTDATRVNNEFSWFIPQTYYTNRRSQVSTVEISSGSLHSDDSNDKILMITYEKGGFNQYVSGNTRPIIGYATELEHRVMGNGELLVDARPQQIVLKILDDSKDAPSGNLSGAITLKFSYYSASQSIDSLQSEYTVGI